MLTDIHTHIVPNVDDGARSMEESLALLDKLAAQGVTSCIATPHFYANNCLDLNAHLDSVKHAFQQLEAARTADMPHIYLGHEVHYFKGISSCEDMKKLTINNTNYFLLELPYADLPQSVADEIIDINLNLGLKPILAHIERYLGRRGIMPVLETIRDGYALAHINSDTLLDNKGKKLCYKLISDGLVSFVASDTHSLDYRPPHLAEAMEVIKQKFGSNFIKQMQKNAESLTQARTIQACQKQA